MRRHFLSRVRLVLTTLALAALALAATASAALADGTGGPFPK